MTDASAARTKAVFEFKSATLPLIAVILKTADLAVLTEALDVQLADSPDFFEQEPVVIDLSQLPQEDAVEGGIDFVALRSILARHQTQPVPPILSFRTAAFRRLFLHADTQNIPRSLLERAPTRTIRSSPATPLTCEPAQPSLHTTRDPAPAPAPPVDS